MVAVIGLPGTQMHRWERVSSKKEAVEWFRRTEVELIALCPNRPDVYATQRVLTEKEAARLRYEDGTRIYPQ